MANLGFIPALLALASSRKAGGGESSPSEKDRMIKLNEKEQRFAVKAGGVLIGLGLSGLATWGGWKLYKKWRSNTEAARGLDQANPAAFAKRIRMAVQGVGTDEKILRETISEIPGKTFWNKVISSYRKQYDRNLVNDLEDDLGPGEFLEILQIVSTLGHKKGTITLSLLKSWSQRLRIAFDYKYLGIPGTDEDAVFKVLLEIPSKRGYLQLEKAYLQHTGSELLEDLKSELSEAEQNRVRNIYNSKPL